MPRQLRIQYPGEMHLVMSRDNRRVGIYLGEHRLGQDMPAARQDPQRQMEARRLEPGAEGGMTHQIVNCRIDLINFQ